MEEIWKDVVGYEGYYQVSNLGRVRSSNRDFYVTNKVGEKQHIKRSGKIIRPQKTSNGYLKVVLSKDAEHKNMMIHRMVAQAFISNPDNLPQINHKDEIITNNSVDNLEWCTPKYNANYGTRNQRCVCKQQFRPVIQLSKDGMFIKRWENITSASKALGIDMSQISGVCRHKKEYVTAGGFKWEYALS